MKERRAMSKPRIAPVPPTTIPPPDDAESKLRRLADDLSLELREVAALLAIMREREEAMSNRDDDMEGGLANVEAQLRTIANRVEDCAYHGKAFGYHGKAVAA
jgi:hypothetical protein